MPLRIYAQHYGTRGIENALSRLPGYVRNRVAAEGVFFASRTVVREAKQTNAFIDRTFRLRTSIRVVGSRQTPDAQAVAGGILGVNYAHFVEFGTRYARPHPFMFPAFVASRRRAMRNAQAAMRRAIVRFEQQLGVDPVSFRAF